MTKDLSEMIAKTIKYALLGLLALPFLWSLGALSGSYYRARICAEFPNGLLLGYGSFFDKGGFVLNRVLTLKRADGRALIPPEDFLHHFYFSERAVYGAAGRRRRLSDETAPAPAPYRFAYREDVGFALEKRDAALYRKIKEEAGSLIRIKPPPPSRFLREMRSLMDSAARGSRAEVSADLFMHRDIRAVWSAMLDRSYGGRYRRSGCVLAIFSE